MPSFPLSLPPLANRSHQHALTNLTMFAQHSHTHTPIHLNGGIKKGLLSAVIAPLSQLCLPFLFPAMDKLIALLFLLPLFIFSKDGTVTAGFKGSPGASLGLTDGTQDKLAYHHNHQDHHDGGSGQKGKFCMSLNFNYRINIQYTIRKCSPWLPVSDCFSVF